MSAPEKKATAKADAPPPVPRTKKGWFVKGHAPKSPGRPKTSERVYRAREVFEEMLFKGLTRRGVTRAQEICQWLLTRDDPRIVMDTYFRMLEFFAPKAAQTVKVQDETAALERAFVEIWRERENRRRLEAGLPPLPATDVELARGNGDRGEDAAIDVEFEAIIEARAAGGNGGEPSCESAPMQASEPNQSTGPIGSSEPHLLSAPSEKIEPTPASAPSTLSEPGPKSAPRTESEPSDLCAPYDQSEPIPACAPDEQSEPNQSSASNGRSEPILPSVPSRPSGPTKASEPSDPSAPKSPSESPNEEVPDEETRNPP